MSEDSVSVDVPVVNLIDEVIPAIPPASAAEDQKTEPPKGEATPETEVETTEQAEAKKQSRFQRRLDAQKSARVAAETEARLLRERVATLEAQKQPPSEPAEPERKPDQSYEDYLISRAEYRAEQKTQATLKADREATQRTETQSKATASTEATAKAWVEREAAFIKATPDYEETVGPFVEDELGAFSDAARQLIVVSDTGPQLLHYLATHGKESDAIAELSPRDQKTELVKLAATLGTPAAKKVSSAPAPIKPVGQGRSSTTGISDNDSQAEYEAKRKAQGARWAR